jgi:DNA-binding PadR family transcriptional regulator
MTTTTSKLGERQRGVLRSLEREPYPGGWYWQNHSTTVSILDSLVKRGLVDYTPPLPGRGRGARYRINDAGREAVRT